MGKIFTFVRSDGLYNTLKFIWNALRIKICHTSHTYCLFADRNDIIFGKRGGDVKHKVISDIETLEAINFPRLKLSPWRKWLRDGSRVLILFENDVPIAFGWMHFKCHYVRSVGNLDLGDDKAWLGPYFVHRKYRGRGLQRVAISLGVDNAPKSINAFVTSVNSLNMASLRSFEKSGFQIGMEVLCTTGILAHSKSDVRIRSAKALNYLNIK